MAPHSDGPGAGRSLSLSDLAALVGGSLEGEDGGPVRGVAGLEEAGTEQVSFCALSKYRGAVARSSAAAVIVGPEFELPDDAPGLTLIRVDNPYLAVAAAVAHFHPDERSTASIHASAVIADSANLGEGVGVGPHAVIGADCVIGDASRVGAGCVLAAGTVIGADCELYPRVTVYRDVRLGDRVIVHAGAVLGADGFGYALAEGRHVKIPQIGALVIEDDVEIGANACIDRAALGTTRIGRGTKIDNLVQIGHNCEVGADSILCGQVGLGGSTRVGKGVMVGGQAGLAGHLSVGDGAMIAAASGVTSSIPAQTQVGGYPHLEASRWRRAMAALRSLPELARRVRRLEAKVQAAEGKDS